MQLPLTDALSADVQPSVRRWACLALPDICTNLPPDLKRSRAVSATLRFAVDNSRDVRSALTEISGPLIHLFSGSEVPQELIDWYLGRPSRTKVASPPKLKRFAPLATALSSRHQMDEDPADSTYWLPSVPTDPERAMICAYNMPAVVLTLGPARWHEIQPLHSLLSQDKQDGVRRSLAASLAALAGIIGPEKTSADLVPILETFIFDNAHEVKEAAIEHCSEFLALMSPAVSLAVIPSLLQSLSTKTSTPWRLRDRVASQLPALARHNLHESLRTGPNAFFDLLSSLMKDEVAAVRQTALQAVRMS